MIKLKVPSRTPRMPRKRRADQFQKRWKDLQKLCAHTDSWPQAIIAADKLLDDALKILHFKGKSLGERLVSAQHSLTDSDGVWFGHKLCGKITSQDDITTMKLKEKDVKEALIGIGQALRDIGALKR
ncbi:MAG: hypothetical protein ABI221_01325 [Candidatus Saccharimonadales bacterium]